jgi:endonuclease YncB( thermonuclease family)
MSLHVASMLRAILAAVASGGIGLTCFAADRVVAQDAVASEQRRTVRDVTPPGVTRAYRSERDIRSGQPDPVPEGARLLERARVDHDGTILGGGIAIRLHGVAALEPDRICRSPSGARWACGRRAFVAFYNLVNQQTIACKFAESDGQKGTATCWVGGTELSGWLLRNGLAELAPAGAAEPQLRAAEEAARKAKLGIWAEQPTDTRP